MRAGFNARLLSYAGTRGWNRYSVNLLCELAHLGVDLYLYSSAPLHEEHLRRLPANRYFLRVAPDMPYPLWQEYWLPHQCEADALDVFHTPYHFGLPYRATCACVMTLHDALGVGTNPLRYWRSPQVWAYHAMARRRADRFVTVSEASKTDLARTFDIRPELITVTYEAAAPIFHAHGNGTGADARRRYELEAPYVLYYGGWEARKNVPFLVRAFAGAKLGRTQLVLAGDNPRERPALEALAARAGIADRVRLLGFVEDVDLAGLCAGALCFVYPSRHEGFGLQICEAMAVGCPALVARATSLPEVLGDGGETFSLADTSELTRLLERVASDSEWRAELTRRARRRAGDFSWRAMARKTIDEAYIPAVRARS
jgi:glycosyltransferase involved in cell wall biosynthesis